MSTKTNTAVNTETAEVAAVLNGVQAAITDEATKLSNRERRNKKVVKYGIETGKVIGLIGIGVLGTIGVQKYQARNKGPAAIAE